MDNESTSSATEKQLSQLEKTLKRAYEEDKDNHDHAITNFDAYEAMGMAQTYDTTSKSTKNNLTDSATATIYLERAARVAAQLPEGEVQALGKKDTGKGMLMDILRQKWIYPNANSQRPFRTKMFLLQYGSSQYGYMPIYYDLNVSPSGYIGPDCWLWNPRDFIPQNGFTSVPDMDYCHGIARKSPSFFEDILDDEDEDGGWDKEAIRELIDQIKEGTLESDSKRDTMKQRKERDQDPRMTAVVTRYESGKGGHWITFLPKYGYKVIRDIKNPHKNGKIPFVIKPCIPTFDSFYNIGDFQRSMPMQFANDGLDNFYFEGIKINLFPPIIINANGTVKHTIKQGAGKVWQETQPNSVRRLDTSTAGLSTYQSAKGMAKGAIQSIAGTTDTSANASSAMDPGFGKTPGALKMIQAKESTRDNQDRQLLEEAMAELLDGMLSLIPTMATEDIPVDMFSDEIAKIVEAGFVDVQDILDAADDPEEGDQVDVPGSINNRLTEFMTKAGASMTMSDSGMSARISINPKKLKGLEYKFQLEPNSTAKKTKEDQAKSLVDFIQTVGSLPNALQQYQQSTGKVPDWDMIFTTVGTLTDVPNMDKFFVQGPSMQQPGMAMGPDGQPAPAGGDVAPGAAAGPAGVPQPGAAPQPQVQQSVNPMTGQPHSPEIAQQIAQLQAMRGAAAAHQ